MSTATEPEVRTITESLFRQEIEAADLEMRGDIQEAAKRGVLNETIGNIQEKGKERYRTIFAKYYPSGE